MKFVCNIFTTQHKAAGLCINYKTCTALFPIKFLIVLLLLFPAATYSQNQEIKVLSYNVAFGGLTSGVGAIINRKEQENWKKSFVRGFWQGSIGGFLNYSAKKSIYLINEKQSIQYAVPSKILSSAGNSIVQNAALNEPFLKNWNFDYSFFRFDFSLGAERNFKVRMLPLSFIATAIALPQGKLDIKTTLFTGVMAFKSKDLISTVNGPHDGINYGRAFIYVDDSIGYHIIAHELIHEYQYREHLVFNSYLKKEVSKIKETRFEKILTAYIYPDIPYFIGFYMLESVEPGRRYYRNYYEFEAERSASNKYVPVY